MSFSPVHRAFAWSVHLFTALGLPLAFLAMVGLWIGDERLVFGTLWLSSFVDSVDGTLARRLKVKEVTPTYDGALLDNIVDFLTFVFVPAFSLPALGLLPGHYAWVALFPLMASGYGFCQSEAKTDQSFVGFPSYWNILVLYWYVLDATPLNIAIQCVVFSALVFVPIHYLYPSKTRFLRRITLPVSVLWSFSILPLCIWPDAPWAPSFAWVTLLGPGYYFVASAFHHRREMAARA